MEKYDVPFKYFQHVLLVIQFLILYNHNKLHKVFDDYYKKNIKHTEIRMKLFNTFKILILSLPYLSIIYYDLFYKSFSFSKLGVPDKLNDNLNYMLYLFGSYAIIQVLAQDAGLKTGLNQRNIVQNHFIFFMMCFGMAYSLTKNRSQSMIAAILYFHLKYIVSNNQTSAVCFEDLD
jgi:hypothetical protein